MTKKLLRLPDVLERTGMARATLYRLISSGMFPRPLKPTGGRMSAWPEQQVDDWIESRQSVGTLKKVG